MRVRPADLSWPEPDDSVESQQSASTAAPARRHDSLTEGIIDTLDVAQGRLPACGPVALFLTLRRLGVTADWHELDETLRAGGLGTSEGTLISAARERGLQAELYNHGDFASLRAALSKGFGVLAMTDVGGYSDRDVLQAGSRGDFAGWHWLAVTDAYVDDAGTKWVEYDNPWGNKERMTYERFEHLWERMAMAGIPLGYDKAYVLVGKSAGPKLPTSNADDIRGVSGVTEGANDITRGWNGQGVERFFKGLGELIMSIPKAIENIVHAIFG